MKIQLRALLLANSGVSGLAGNRISWGSAAQGSPMPYAVLWKITDTREVNLRAPTGPYQARVQIDAYGETAKQADDLAEAISAVLHGYSGGIFQGIFHDNARDGREGGSNEATRPFFVKTDFMVHYNPT